MCYSTFLGNLCFNWTLKTWSGQVSTAWHNRCLVSGLNMNFIFAISFFSHWYTFLCSSLASQWPSQSIFLHLTTHAILLKLTARVNKQAIPTAITGWLPLYLPDIRSDGCTLFFCQSPGARFGGFYGWSDLWRSFIGDTLLCSLLWWPWVSQWVPHWFYILTVAPLQTACIIYWPKGRLFLLAFMLWCVCGVRDGFLSLF